MAEPVFDSTSGYGPFRVVATVYAGGEKGASVEAAWVRDFDTVMRDDVAVLYKPLGASAPGLYVKEGIRWRFYLPYEVLVTFFSASTAALDILLAGNSSYTVPQGAKVYRHGVLQPAGTQPGDGPGWSIVDVGVLGEDAVTKPVDPNNPTGTPGALQIAGSGTSIKDWVPPEGGIVSVDADGVPTVLQSVTLQSGAGLPLGQLIIR